MLVNWSHSESAAFDLCGIERQILRIAWIVRTVVINARGMAQASRQ